MATSPIFASTPKTWAGTVPATADTSLTAPANQTTIVTAGASGTMITRIRLTLLGSITGTVTQVNLFLYDGATYHLYEQCVISARSVSSTTSEPSNLFDKYYTDLNIQTGWSLRATVTTAAGQSLVKVIAHGADY
jgi:hypothetical protein